MALLVMATAAAERDEVCAADDFERLMRRHERLVFVTALRLTGSVEDANGSVMAMVASRRGVGCAAR